MAKRETSSYEKLVFVAYGYFIILGVAGLAASFYFGAGLNYWALGTVLIFSAQAYFHKRLTNLIVGVLALGVSIFWTLEFISYGHTAGYNFFACTMLTACVLSLVMSGVLIFSYTKLAQDMQ